MLRGVTSFVHRAFLYRDDTEWLDEIVPFLREAVIAGDPALAAVSNRRIELLREALGADASMVELVSIEAVGKNPGRIMSLWYDFAEQHAPSQHMRAVGEPVWPDRRADEVAECHRHEQLLNVALDGRDLELVCPYDTTNLADDVIESALRSHPVVGTTGRSAPSDAYALDVSLAGDLVPPPAGATSIGFDIQTLRARRNLVESEASRLLLASARSADLALAVSEVMTNSLLYARGGVLTWWAEPGRFVCEIRDGGRLTDAMVGRRRPAADAPRGRGVWMVHQMCDLVQIRSSDDGTTVRLTMDLDTMDLDVDRTGPSPHGQARRLT
jgi:anti-sigma regulatory factor (Ser/Thr protein kinase)